MNSLLFISHATDKYTTVDSVELVLKGGCRSVQLRMKESQPDEILATGYLVKEMCDYYNAELYIDDFPMICRQLNATGVHLGKNDMSPVEARRLLGNQFIIGGTANTWEDIQHLQKAGVDYIGLGPFRFTTTKTNLSPVLGLQGYEEIMLQCREKNIGLPVVAIGGIGREDIPALMQTGITGIALSSSILRADNPVQETGYIIEQIKQYEI